jgi:predicted regulator of Ras-like GTPase activity (Roadblock/LC7/MglB family)
MSDEQYYYLLETLYNNIEDIRSAAIISREGLIVHSILEEGISDVNLAAMTATLLSVGETALKELKSGHLDVCTLQGDEGNFVIMEAGIDLIIAVCVDIDARMDTCFIEMRKISEQLKRIS